MDYEHLARFAVADMDAARPLAVLTVPSGCRNAACAGVGSLFRLASRTWPGDEAFHDWLLQQVCEGCASPV